LVLTDIVQQSLQKTVEQTKALNAAVQIESVVGDLNSEEFVDKSVSKAITLFGALNYAVNVAGIAGVTRPTNEMELEEYRATQQINMEGLWLCERAEIRAMLAQDLKDGFVQNSDRSPH
jgi:NAD(P)-dependent dehydrogenase (short-subunit alcohol dehydrogenase family)